MARAAAAGMIVYRAQGRIEDTRALLDRLRQAAATETRELLTGFGELESGVADALCPERDAPHETTSILRAAALEIGRAFFRGHSGRTALERAAAARLPERVRIGIPEGYAYYALYPEAYREAARRFYLSEGPRSATVIGIRSIGTSLSAAVAGALAESGCETASYTVRPRGHPFERRVEAAPELEAEVLGRRGSWFAVVDEGPGLSGSSFASVAAWLSRLGVPDERIVLFPSWHPDGCGFVSQQAQARWARHRKYSVPFEEIRGPWPEMRDVSAGRWRENAYPSQEDWPAVNPQHERRKYLRRGSNPVMLRFAGLGEYGRTKRDLALRLADAGFSPRVEGLDDGFLATRFETGRPLTAADLSPALIERMACYLAFRKRTLPAQPGANFDELVEMIRVNTGADSFESVRAAAAGVAAAAIDGRMLPHEWIQTDGAILKTDAVDHHDDHFYPGNQDIAWDLAGCAIEFRMPPEAEERLLESYIRITADRDIRYRISFYRAAYAAFRLGYAEMSAGALQGSNDGQRFQELTAFYEEAFVSACGTQARRRSKPLPND